MYSTLYIYTTCCSSPHGHHQVDVQNINEFYFLDKTPPLFRVVILFHFSININIIPNSGIINVKMFKKSNILLKYACYAYGYCLQRGGLLLKTKFIYTFCTST
jgi:hypothetical protein